MNRDHNEGILVNTVAIRNELTQFKDLKPKSIMKPPICTVLLGGFILNMIIHQDIKNIYYASTVLICFLVALYFAVDEYKKASQQIDTYNKKRRTIYNRLRYIESKNIIFDPVTQRQILLKKGCIDKLVRDIVINDAKNSTN